MSDDQPTVPYGFCHCGCGERTKPARQTSRAFGWRKGEPLRFIHGHQWKGRQDRWRVEDCGYETPCWVWQMSLFPSGYAAESRRRGKTVTSTRAHRNIWEQKNGPVPEGLVLDHLCRNRACVNPDHLEPVTQAENSRRGSNTILTVEQVHEIREAIAQGELYKVIGARYGVARQTISNIAQGRAWRDVT